MCSFRISMVSLQRNQLNARRKVKKHFARDFKPAPKFYCVWSIQTALTKKKCRTMDDFRLAVSKASRSARRDASIFCTAAAFPRFFATRQRAKESSPKCSEWTATLGREGERKLFFFFCPLSLGEEKFFHNFILQLQHVLSRVRLAAIFRRALSLARRRRHFGKSIKPCVNLFGFSLSLA